MKKQAFEEFFMFTKWTHALISSTFMLIKWKKHVFEAFSSFKKWRDIILYNRKKSPSQLTNHLHGRIVKLHFFPEKTLWYIVPSECTVEVRFSTVLTNCTLVTFSHCENSLRNILVCENNYFSQCETAVFAIPAKP